MVPANTLSGVTVGAGSRLLLLRIALAAAAVVLLFLSAARPWWSLMLYAPQYPQGLQATAFLTRLEGDVAEIDQLNHYIGMIKLGDAARMEKELVPYLLPAFAVLTLASLFVRGRRAWILNMPLASFPLVFALDLKGWLWVAGHSLDQRAALSQAIKPFTPDMFGWGKIAQFQTFAWYETGMTLAVAAAVLALASAMLSHWELPSGQSREQRPVG